MESIWQHNAYSRMLDSWVEASKAFWQLDTRQPGPVRETEQKDAPEGREPDADGDSARCRTYRAWEAAAGNFTMFLRMIGTPQNHTELYTWYAAFAEVMAQTAGDALENVAELQKQLISGFAKAYEHTKGYSIDNLDHAAFESFRELYRSEIQKYLNMPKIGLPREYHERLSNLADSSTLFSLYLTELLYLFSRPFEKANSVMQQKIRHMLDRGDCDFLKDTQQTYGEWIKILEDHFMELLKSEEYTQVLNETIVSLAAYKSVRREVMNVILRDLQIPTSREMDDVYRDLYQMKKKIRELSRQLESLRNDR